MGCKETLSTQVETDLKAEVDEYRERNGLDSLSEATEELILIGLHETQNPLLYRVKQQAKDAAFYLSLVAVVTVVIGMMTTALTAGNSIQIAMVLLAFGAAPLAIVEVGRMVLDYSTRARGDEL